MQVEFSVLSFYSSSLPSVTNRIWCQILRKLFILCYNDIIGRYLCCKISKGCLGKAGKTKCQELEIIGIMETGLTLYILYINISGLLYL